MGAKLQEALKKARKEYGIQIGGLDSLPDTVDSISTGNIGVDYITGVGGLPRGRLVELFGPPSSGKTTTALQTAVSAQRDGLPVLYLDYEHAIDKRYAEALGLAMEEEKFLLVQPESLEQGVNVARKLISTGEIGLAIWDSVAAMVPQAELEGETGEQRVALAPRLMAQTMRQITGLLHETNTLGIFLNHLQEVIETTPMGRRLASQGVQRKTTPGGKALKFYASVRIEYKPIGGIRDKTEDTLTREEKDILAGNKVMVICVKNKVGPPFREAEVQVRYGRGFSQAATVLAILVAHGVLKKEAGGVYRINKDLLPDNILESWSGEVLDQDWVRGESNFIGLLDSQPVWLAYLEDKARLLLTV